MVGSVGKIRIAEGKKCPSIPGILEAVRGLTRVLKPNGKLIFFELGLSPDRDVQRWQERLEPLQLVLTLQHVQ